MGSDWYLHLPGGIGCICKFDANDTKKRHKRHRKGCPHQHPGVNCGSGFTANQTTFQIFHAMTMAILHWGAVNWNSLTGWMNQRQRNSALEEWVLWVRELRAYRVVDTMKPNPMGKTPLDNMVTFEWWTSLPKRLDPSVTLSVKSKRKRTSENWQDLWEAFRLCNRQICRWRWGIEAQMQLETQNRPCRVPKRHPRTFLPLSSAYNREEENPCGPYINTDPLSGDC